ncbi:alpha/beta fold hydrolase [Algicella marina]|uniref:Alpha/beta fold hydrolase n=1 Tax=Algicella marina TaxID=2683284 RepID=A0A6P1SVF6_9RHOB|nr:alpha/beta fold hydrolase [Algicella marina]QHQ33757.1 alpha/beta fold hydrolase [Algicella marina]
MLNYIEYAPEHEGRPLVIAHGLYGSARNWGVLAKRLCDTRTVVTVDMRNHGDSPWFDSHTYEDMAKDLAEVIGSLGGEADVLGHSMGGKAAMMLALTRPDRVAHLIVADISPVAYGHSQIEYIEAMRAVDLSGVTRRSEADAGLAKRVADPMLRAFLLQSLSLADGKARWKLNLDVLAEDMDGILDFPAVEGSFDGPVRFIHGSKSDYVKDDYHGRIRELFPLAEFDVLEGAGHWLHAEDPRGFEAMVRCALKRQAT